MPWNQRYRMSSDGTTVNSIIYRPQQRKRKHPRVVSIDLTSVVQVDDPTQVMIQHRDQTGAFVEKHVSLLSRRIDNLHSTVEARKKMQSEVYDERHALDAEGIGAPTVSQQLIVRGEESAYLEYKRHLIAKQKKYKLDIQRVEAMKET